MPTTKHRINIVVPNDVDHVVQRLAKRDRISVASKTLDLLRRALEIEEDVVLQEVAESREKSSKKFVSHASAWK